MERKQVVPFCVASEHSSRLPDGRLRCDVCPRACTLHDGQRAFCFVREARGGEVVLTSYGLSTGFCIDPIEKKPLYHFYPGSAVLSFGTAGCNLGCRFCQNWDISKAQSTARLSSAASPHAIAKAALAHDCTSVAFTYNDPVVFYEYAVDTALACHERGVKTVAVTAGYIAAAARPGFFAPMDAANVDLKAFSERFYTALCLGHLEPVKETLVYLARETPVWLELTTLLLPGENDSEAEIAALCEWVASALGPNVPLHFSAFHPDFKMLDLPPTTFAVLQRARAQARAAGLHHVYTGNVHDPAGQSTVCATCAAMLIERDGYALGHCGLDRAGACATCGAPLAGRFAPQLGTWGARREPVHIGNGD